MKISLIELLVGAVLTAILGVLVFMGILTFQGCGGADSVEESSRALEAAKSSGLTNVDLHSVAWWECSDEDSVITSRKFSATNSEGESVNGTACCGLFLRGCTIRW